ncbi:formyltransferase family protein [Candidatus Pelagibacter sp. HIMB1542]|uniref:formyltransferase family protein n=1 Tax=Candidatus Pelagibacter sp. HIMB1542 TaxID=3413346 RepID=UPI003F82DA1B
MKVTLFTSNNYRHNYFINLLSNICDELYVIQECKTLFKGKNNEKYQNKNIIDEYFNKVLEAQDKIFKKEFVNKNNKTIKLLPVLYGEVNKLPLSFLENFLKSDIYVVFGSSYIKGELLDFLTKQGSINIHAGVSPYYRGADCNFWALYDDNPHLVGSTIHLLSKGLDSGPILYHAMSNLKINPFEYTMSTLKSAFHSVSERIQDGTILTIKPLVQDESKEVRYSKKSEFNEEIVKKYFKKEVNLNKKKIDSSLLKDPFFLK